MHGQRIRTRFWAARSPSTSRTGGLGAWLIATCCALSKQGAQPCRDSRKKVLCSIHNYAAFLRRLASRTHAETARAPLFRLADQFDQLAESIHRARVAA
jgi:hypothetical protein